jgi:hypothetical protein
MAKKKAHRTTMYSSKGKKLYAVRDKEGQFEDIQTYARAHRDDMAHKSKAEIAAAAKTKAKPKAKPAAKPMAKPMSAAKPMTSAKPMAMAKSVAMAKPKAKATGKK